MKKEDEKILAETYGAKREELADAFVNLRQVILKEITPMFEISVKLLGYLRFKKLDE